MSPRKLFAFIPAVGLVLLALPVGAEDDGRLELSIVGTKIEVDKVGLPTILEGMVFYRGGPRDGLVAGTYSEKLKPVLDPELGLVGTRGEAVFRFVRRQAGVVIFEDVVTLNQSQVVGEIPGKGALLVESTGRIVKGTKMFEKAGGRLVSSSTVVLGPTFRLDVNLTLTFGERGADPSPAETRMSDSSLVVTIGEGGEVRVRYSGAFKKSLLRRMQGDGAVSPEELAAETGLSEVLLRRWSAQARQLVVMNKLLQSLSRQTPREWTFEEKHGVVIRTARYSEEELGEFLLREGIARTDLTKWRHAIETLEAGSGKGSGASGGKARSEDAKPAPLDLEAVRKMVEALLGGGDAGERKKPGGD